MYSDESTPEQVDEELMSPEEIERDRAEVAAWDVTLPSLPDSPEERLLESLQSGNDGIPTDAEAFYEQGDGEDDPDD